MTSLEQYTQQLNQLLDRLVQIATKLRDVSRQVISEEELSPLQQEQEDVLHRIESLDQTLQQSFKGEISREIHQRVHEKLQTFQQLNQEFINNLGSSHGLIQFELRHLPGENEEFSERLLLRRSSSTLSSPDSTPTIEPEEKE